MPDPDLMVLRQQAERGDRTRLTNSSRWPASEVTWMNCERLPIVAAAMRSTSSSSWPANEVIEMNCDDLLPAVIKMQPRYLPNSTGTQHTKKWNSA